MAYDKVVDSAKLDGAISATADAIRSKTGKSDAIPWDDDTGFADAVRDIETGGGSGSPDYNLPYASKLTSMFEGATMPDGTDITVYAPNITDNIERVISYANGIRSLKLVGNKNNNAVSCQYAFRGNTIEILDFTEWGDGCLKPSYANNMLGSGPKLHTIRGELDFSACVNAGGVFGDLTALQHIRIRPETMKLSFTLQNVNALTAESVQSIVDGLADLTGQTAQTVKFDTKIALTEDQKSEIAAKNWTLVQ